LLDTSWLLVASNFEAIFGYPSVIRKYIRILQDNFIMGNGISVNINRVFGYTMTSARAAGADDEMMNKLFPAFRPDQEGYDETNTDGIAAGKRTYKHVQNIIVCRRPIRENVRCHIFHYGLIITLIYHYYFFFFSLSSHFFFFFYSCIYCITKLLSFIFGYLN